MRFYDTICLDFGNTRRKAALFKKGNLVDIAFLDGELEKELPELLQNWQPRFAVLSSVINHGKDIEDQLHAFCTTHILQAGSKLPFTTPVGKPSPIGADRLALCAAAVQRFPGKNNLVIGLGSAVTYNFLNVKNEFLGGGISPGMHMRMRSLNAYTAKLPIVAPSWNVPLVGYDTQTNIQSGVVLGLALEIDGFIEQYRSKYRAINVLLTGGDLTYLSPHIKNEIFADPDLLFKGLNAIGEANLPSA